MLMIFLMAILSLDLIHYSNQNRNTDTGQEARAGYGLYHFTDAPSTVQPYRNTTPQLASTTVVAIKKKAKLRKRKLPHNDTASSHTSPQAKKKPSPKSDMQVMQFYAQPMTTFDINYHPPIYENYNPLVNGILNMNDQPLYNTIQTIPTPESIPFKTLPSSYDQFQPLATTWNVPPADRVQKVPIYDPFNVLKRKPAVQPVRLRQVKVAPKILPIRPVTPTTTLPPITVTHIYKYEETDSGLKLPFASNEDSFVENFPAISAALDGHLNGPSNVVRLNTYVPAKLPQPVIYEMPTLEPVFRNEFDILHKFNEALKTQTQNMSPLHNGHQSGEYDDTSKENQDEKNYTDEDVKKALHYIRTLKKNRPTKANRGSKKFNAEKSDDKRKAKDGSSEEKFEDDDDQRKKRPKNKPDSFEEDDNFKIKSMEELDEGESKKKIVKSEHKPVIVKTAKPTVIAKTAKPTKPTKPTKTANDKKNAVNANADLDDKIPYQESQIVPTLDHEDQMSPPDFSQNTELGGASSEDRVEFQMHGLRGPESYKFGYDTGKGENRQFRYEERDPDGRVKGHFGYYDKDGKMQVFNYEADPEHGYHLEQAHP